ncbi:MAG: PEGA domain-containing protein [Patescibacteria group bacterium]
MNLASRRLIYLGFFLIFIVAGSALLFYLQGFRYNPDKKEVEQVGAINLSTTPNGATIFLNGQKYSHITPTTVNSLAGGEYEVTLKKDDLQVWQKKLTVKPKQVVSASDVILWLPPQIFTPTSDNKISSVKNKTLVENNIALHKISHNNQTLLYTTTATTNNLWLLNLRSGESDLLAPPTGFLINEFNFSPSSQKILFLGQIQNKPMAFIYYLTQQKWEKVLAMEADSFDKLTWGESDDYLLKQNDDNLWLIDLGSGEAKLIWEGIVTDWKMNDNLIYLLVPQNDNLVLKIINSRNLKNINLAEPLILSNNSSFLTTRGDWLPITDETKHLLYLIRSPLKNSSSLRKLTAVTAIDWFNNNSKMIVANNYEIWEYEPLADNLNLIWRISTPLTRVRQYLNKPYLLLTSGSSLWALEFDRRGDQQRFLLADYGLPITDFFINQDGTFATVLTDTKIYQLPLKPQRTEGYDWPINLP